jgi:uncharacterized membrane protein YeaQ/YmgE (transglycosylase-associated protein family)
MRISELEQETNTMDLRQLVLLLLIGLAAGWLAGRIMKGKGFGVLGDMIIGVIGAVLGGWLFGVLGLAVAGVLGRLITATVGAILLLYVIRLVKRA